MPKHVCGVVAVVGLPNAGKSTLVNALVGEKVAIVTKRPQTTRSLIRGIRTSDAGQIIFVDTPGIHRSDSYFNRRMMGSVREAVSNPDVRAFVADAAKPVGETERQALDTLRRAHDDMPRPSMLILTKVDLVDDKRLLLPLIERYLALFPFDETIPVSAVKGDGIEELAAAILAKLPVGEPMFPADQFTDQPERYLAAEMIREQILAATHDEIPHSVAVRVEEWEDKKTLTRISATITVERVGQKAIIIGARGAMLKRIGMRARAQIEQMLGRKIFLELFVQVTPDWRENEAFVNQLDWRGEGNGTP
jgi:GTPase